MHNLHSPLIGVGASTSPPLYPVASKGLLAPAERKVDARTAIIFSQENFPVQFSSTIDQLQNLVQSYLPMYSKFSRETHTGNITW